MQGTGEQFMDYTIPVGEEWLGGIPETASEKETKCYEDFFTSLWLTALDILE